MTAQPAKSIALKPLLQTRSGLIIHQALYPAAKLGVADLLERSVDTLARLAAELKVNEDALYRLLRALASQGIFEETAPRTFKNSGISHCLRKDEPGSVFDDAMTNLSAMHAPAIAAAYDFGVWERHHGCWRRQRHPAFSRPEDSQERAWRPRP